MNVPADAGSRDRVLLEPAVVLHRRAYRETSLLLDVFTENHGRLRLLAKGVKRGRRASAGILQPFMRLGLSWSGRGDLPVLTAAEPSGESVALDGTAAFCGFYLNELILHLLPSQDPHPEVFRLYLAALGQLGAEASREPALRNFELSLLEEIGYGLCLDRADDRPIDPAKTYLYVFDQGPVEAADDMPHGIRGSTLLALKGRRFDDPDQRREAKRLLRGAIGHHLNGRPLKSRELFKAIGITPLS